MENSNKSIKNKFALSVAIILTIFASVFSGCITYQYNDIKYWNNLIYPRVTIDGVDLSGKTRDEAVLIIKQLYEEKLKSNKINIKSDDRMYIVDYSKLKL